MTKNILFYLDESFTHFGIAKKIYEKTDFKISCIIDVSYNLKNFFETQNLIKFSGQWDIRDIDLNHFDTNLNYLKNFEKKYSIDLWKRIFSDGNFVNYNDFYNFSYDEILHILQQECKILENAVLETNPDYLLIKTTDHHKIQLLYEICKSLGIKPLMLSPTRFGYKTIISDDFDIFPLRNSKTKNLENFSDGVNYFKKFNSFEQQKNRSKRENVSLSNKIQRTTSFVRSAFDNKNSQYYQNFGKSGPALIFNKFISTPYNKRQIWNFFNKYGIKKIENQPFVYFPLHVEPERTLSISSTFYMNQLEVITHLAKSIPINFSILVKEHPFMVKMLSRPLKYYHELLKLPNIKLVHPSIDPKLLLSKASIVATISGTSSIEAAFYKKPSLTFSDTSFTTLPFVYRIKNLNELPSIIQKCINDSHDFSDLTKYLSSLENNSFEFDLVNFISGIKTYLYSNDQLKNSIVTENHILGLLNKFNSEFELLSEKYVKQMD